MNETEEEQVEALKKWWADNGRAIILGVVIGGGAIFGWRFWEAQQLRQAMEASDTYSTTYSEFLDDKRVAVTAGEKTLRDEFSGTPYAALAALLKAKMAVDEGDFDGAAESLRWAMTHSPEEDVRHIATLRLARVLHANEQGEQAIELLDTTFPEAFMALAQELKGDILVSQGNTEQAREAYSRALGASEAAGGSGLLQMKIDDLAGQSPS